MIKIYKEATPVITSLSLRNLTSSAASTVTVKIIGRALSSIKNAENENNRKVYIYSDDGLDPVEATYDLVNGVDTYTAEINIPENTLNVDVSDEVLAERRAKWQPREPKVTTGYLARYAAMVTSGNRGAILEVPKAK